MINLKHAVSLEMSKCQKRREEDLLESISELKCQLKCQTRKNKELLTDNKKLRAIYAIAYDMLEERSEEGEFIFERIERSRLE